MILSAYGLRQVDIVSQLVCSADRKCQHDMKNCRSHSVGSFVCTTHFGLHATYLTYLRFLPPETSTTALILFPVVHMYVHNKIRQGPRSPILPQYNEQSPP